MDFRSSAWSVAVGDRVVGLEAWFGTLGDGPAWPQTHQRTDAADASGHEKEQDTKSRTQSFGARNLSVKDI